MASGLDTDSIISQLMAIEQNKVTAVQMRQVRSRQHKDDLTAIKTKLDAFKTAAAASATPRPWKPTQTTTSVGPDEARRHAARRRRHRRPLDPGRQARLLRPARLHVHARARPPARSTSTSAPTRARPTPARSRSRSAPTPPPPTSRRRSTPTRARRSTPRSSRTPPTTSASSSPPARPARARTSRVDSSAMGAGSSLTEDATYKRTGTTLNAVLPGRRRRRRRARRSPTSSRTRSRACG